MGDTAKPTPEANPTPEAPPPQLPQAAGVPVLQADLTELQVGIEAAAAQGTLVAATRKIPYVSATLTPAQDRKTLEERGTVLADTGDVVVKQGVTLELVEEFNTETIIAALLCCAESTTPTTTANMPEVWEFEPSVTVPSTVDTATWEFAATDGAAAAYRGRFGFARPTALSIEASEGTTQLSTTWMGRALQSLAAATAVAAPDRFIVPAPLWKVSINDTFAAIGTTPFGVVRSFTFGLDPGISEAPALAGRADLDVAYWRRGRIRGGVSMVVDTDADAAGELAHWRNGDLRYIRLEASNGAAGAALRKVVIDAVGRYIDSPNVLAEADAQHTLDLNAALRADVAKEILRIEVTNGLATF